MQKITFLLILSFVIGLQTTYGQEDLKIEYFFRAVENEDYSKITRYLENGVSVNQILEDQRTHKGVSYNGRKSRTPLLQAIKLKKPNLVRFLVEYGANVNQSIEVTWYEECTDCSYDVYYRKPRLKKTQAIKPISWAIEWGDTTIVDFLISNGADYSAENTLIKQTGNLEVIQFFSAKNIEFNFLAEDLEAVYMLGYKRDCAQYILEQGVIANAATLNQMVSWSDSEMLAQAVENGADVNAYYQNQALSMCPLCEAVLNCDLEMTKLLIEQYDANTEPTCTAYFGGNTTVSRLTPLQIATDSYIGKCKGRNDEMIEYLIFANDE